MKKLVLLAIAILIVSAVSAQQPGAIWTIPNSCGDATQDENHYAVGDHVFINGDGFEPGEYDWYIEGQPGGASCDPDAIVAGGTGFTVAASGEFCFDAYLVMEGDCGEYNVVFDGKQDNYRVDDGDVPPSNEIPEWNTLGALLTLAGAGVVFAHKRR